MHELIQGIKCLVALLKVNLKNSNIRDYITYILYIKYN